MSPPVPACPVPAGPSTTLGHGPDAPRSAARPARRLRRLGLVFALALSLAGCGGGGGGGGGGGDTGTPPPPAPPGGGTPALFTATQLLPLAPGHRWVYRLQDTLGTPQDTLVTTVTGQQTVAGQSAWRVQSRSQFDASNDDEEFFRVEADGIRSVPGPAADPFTTQLGPALVLRATFSPGDTWVVLDRDLGSTLDLDGDGRLDRVRARADVTVQPVATLATAAGTLSGLAHLRTVTTLTVTPGAGGPTVTVRITSDDWYAPGIGPVRSSTRADDPDFNVAVDLAVLAWSVGAQRSDTQPPALTDVQPADGSTDLTANPAYTFSEPMDRRAMEEGGFTLLDAQGQPVPGSLAWNAEGTGFSFLAVFGLAEGRYSARFGPGATDLIGNPLPTATFTFSVDRSGPVLLGSSPLPDSSSVAPDVVIELQFNEPIGNVNPLFILTLLDNGAEVTVTGEVLGTRVRIQPPSPLVPGGLYRVRSVGSLVDAQITPGDAVDFSFRVAAGRFGLGQTLPGALQLSTVRAADIDSDGRADLLGIGTRSDAATPGVRLLLWRQQATGGLATAETLPVPQGCEAHALDVGDVDADGRRDVVFSAFSVSDQACGVGWLRQAVDGSLVFAGWVTQDVSPRTVRLLPWPGQLRPALVVGEATTLELFTPQDASGFAPARGLARPLTDLREILVADLDGDGRSDLVLLGRMGSGAIGWAAMRQTEVGDFRSLGEQEGLDCRQFNECGLALAPAGASGRTTLFAGFARVDEFTNLSFTAQQLSTAGNGLWTVDATLPVALAPHAMALADIDGDGRADLVVAHGPQGAVGVHLRRADGLWEPQALAAAPVTDGAPRSLAVADFNGDGLPDIVLGASLLLQNPTAVGGPAGGMARPSSLGAAARAAMRTPATR